MRWKLWISITAVCLAFTTLAWWQHREYVQECELAGETLHRQSHSVMNALLGGIKTHRRRGRFFADQFQGSLDGLAEAGDVLAVGIAAEDGHLLCSAGSSQLLNPTSLATAGDFWDPSGFRLVERFELPPSSSGFGAGGGLGRRRGAFSEAFGPESSDGPFTDGGWFAGVLVMDRAQYDVHCQRAAWLRGTLVAAGTLLLLGMTVAWYVTVRAAGRTRQLETEARHLRDLGQAAAGLAHETRNPLGLIRGWAQRLVQAGFESPAKQEQAEAIVEECDRVTARINQFLAFARPPEPKMESVRLLDLCNELAIILEPDLDSYGIQCRPITVSAKDTVRADRELLRQALFNLLQNAVQASPEGDEVDVTIRTRQDGRRRIEVANRGPSVPDESVESLFTPYFTTRPGGTGLGLAIVRHIANVHGWEAGYSPRADGGSVFWLDGLHG